MKLKPSFGVKDKKKRERNFKPDGGAKGKGSSI